MAGGISEWIAVTPSCQAATNTAQNAEKEAKNIT
jgi:hypothetical protein